MITVVDVPGSGARLARRRLLMVALAHRFALSRALADQRAQALRRLMAGDGS